MLVETRHNEVDVIRQPAQGKGNHYNNHHLHHLQDKSHQQESKSAVKQKSTAEMSEPRKPNTCCCVFSIHRVQDGCHEERERSGMTHQTQEVSDARHDICDDLNPCSTQPSE